MKKNLTVLLTLLLVLTLVLSLTACGGSSSSAPASSVPANNASANNSPSSGTVAAQSEDTVTTSKTELIMASNTEPGNLRQDSLMGLSNYILLRQCYDMLLEVGADGNYSSNVLESITLDEDSMGASLVLKQGILFHNGEECTAEDILFDMQIVRSESAYGALMSFLDLDNVEILDRYSLHVPFNSIYGPWQSGFTQVYIFSKSAYEAVGATEFWLNPVTTGPYMLEEWVQADHLTFKRFDDYFMGAPILEKITMRIITESSVQLMELQTGGVDLIWNIGSEQVDSVAADPNLTLQECGGLNLVYMGMNCNNEALSDLRVRQAISYCIDRDLIVQGSWNNKATVSYSILGPNATGYNDAFEGDNYPYPVNIEKAKELLAEAGYGDGLTLKLVVDSTAERQLAAEQIYNMLQPVGINVEIQQMDFATVTSVLNNTNDYDLYIRGIGVNGGGEGYWVLINPGLYGLTHFESDAGPGYEKWSSVLDSIASETDINKRVELYKEVQEVFYEDGVYFVPLCFPNTYGACASNFVGWSFLNCKLNVLNAYFE